MSLLLLGGGWEEIGAWEYFSPNFRKISSIMVQVPVDEEKFDPTGSSRLAIELEKERTKLFKAAPVKKDVAKKDDEATPTPALAQYIPLWTSISCWERTALLLCTRGGLFVMGKNLSSIAPRSSNNGALHRLCSVPQTAVDVQLHSSKAGVICSSGVIYAWGDASWGELGTNNVSAGLLDQPTAVTFKKSNDDSRRLLSPAKAPSRNISEILRKEDNSEPLWSQFAFGANCSLFVSREGSVFSVGSRASAIIGHMGLPSHIGVQLKNVSFFPKATITGLSCSAEHAVAWDSEGCGWAWGKNTYGCLGVQASKSRAGEIVKTPEKIVVMGTTRILSMLASNGSTWALTHRGRPFFWGRFREHSPKVEYEAMNLEIKPPLPTESADDSIHIVGVSSWADRQILWDTEGYGYQSSDAGLHWIKELADVKLIGGAAGNRGELWIGVPRQPSIKLNSIVTDKRSRILQMHNQVVKEIAMHRTKRRYSTTSPGLGGDLSSPGDHPKNIFTIAVSPVKPAAEEKNVGFKLPELSLPERVKPKESRLMVLNQIAEPILDAESGSPSNRESARHSKRNNKPILASLSLENKSRPLKNSLSSSFRENSSPINHGVGLPKFQGSQTARALQNRPMKLNLVVPLDEGSRSHAASKLVPPVPTHSLMMEPLSAAVREKAYNLFDRLGLNENSRISGIGMKSSKSVQHASPEASKIAFEFSTHEEIVEMSAEQLKVTMAQFFNTSTMTPLQQDLLAKLVKDWDSGISKGYESSKSASDGTLMTKEPFSSQGPEFYKQLCHIILSDPKLHVVATKSNTEVKDLFKGEATHPKQLYLDLVKEGKAEELVAEILNMFIKAKQQYAAPKSLELDKRAQEQREEDYAIKQRARELVQKALDGNLKFSNKVTAVRDAVDHAVNGLERGIQKYKKLYNSDSIVIVYYI